MKDRLVFDTTDADTIAASDSVGAYVRGSNGVLIDTVTIASVDRLAVDATLKDGAGTALTSTLLSGKQALDVNMVNNISVDIDGVYNVSTNPTPDSAGMIAHVRNATVGAAQQTFRSTGGQPISDDVVGANIFALDVNSFGMAWDGSAWDRLTSTSGNLNVNINAATGTVTVTDAALANTAISAAANVLDTADTAEAAVASVLSNRKYLWLYNNDNTRVFIGGAGVTAADGFPVSPGSYMEMRAGAAVPVNFIGQSGKTPQIRTLQLS